MSAAELSIQSISFRYRDHAEVLSDVGFAARRGECWGVIGPNGAGKSTLLRIIAGLLKPSEGRIELDGRELGTVSPRDRARKMAYLPQRIEGEPNLSAGQVVLLGRYPFRGLGMFESAADIQIAREAMSLTETLAFENRSMGSLSGGEAQRVHIAAVMAQQPEIILLDEPTTALDWKHQLAIFDVVRTAVADGKLVVVVTHDLNLAARYCDRVLLLDRGRVAASGTVSEVLTPETLTPVYGVDVGTARSAALNQEMLFPASTIGDSLRKSGDA